MLPEMPHASRLARSSHWPQVPVILFVGLSLQKDETSATEILAEHLEIASTTRSEADYQLGLYLKEDLCIA
jgi:hypothetical protein